ncbi:MAG: HEAT repeat domain-containing protein [Isosphaeraceae bacterium]
MRWSSLLGLVLVLCAEVPARAGDEPVMGGKTVGEWIAIVQDRGRPTNERDRAIDVLGHLGPAAARAVPCLIQVVDEPRTGNTKVDKDNERLRSAAIQVLGRIGPAAAEAVPKLFPGTGDGRIANGQATGQDWAMSRALGRIGRPAIPALIRALQGKDPDLRRFAVGSLGLMQDEAAEAVPALITALDDPALEPHVADALGLIGPAAAPAVPALAVKLRQSDYGSGDILDALPRIGAAAVPVMVEVFRKEAGDFLRPNEDIAPDVEGFLRLGPDAREAAPALRPYLTDRRPAIRAAAAVALGAIAPETPGVVPALIEVLKYPRHDPKDARAVTPEQDARSTYGQDAALVLGWIGPPARAALPALLECLKEQEQFEDSDWNEDRLPVRFPGLIGVMIRIDPTGKLVVPALIRAIREGDMNAMLEATMIEPIPPVVIKALAVAANDDEEAIAPWARNALARIGPAAAPAVPAQIRGLDAEGWVDAAEALGAIGPAAKAAVPALERHVKAGDYRCAWAAIALHQIDPTNRAANEYLVRMVDSPWPWSRAPLAGALGRWSLEAESFTREALFTGSRRNCVSGYDWYSSGMCDPDLLRRLGRFGPGARAAVPELKRLLTYRDRFVRRWAADALRRIEAKPAR